MMTVDDFRKAVVAYQLRLKAVEQEMPDLGVENFKEAYLFKRQRSPLFALPVVHRFPRVLLTSLLPKLGKLMDENEDLPARIEVFCLYTLSPLHSEMLKEMMVREYNVELTIFDRASLSQVKEFESLKDDEPAEFEDIDEGSKVLYNMLAEGSNVSEIKSNLICSVIIFIVSEHESITLADLRQEAEDRLKHEVGSIQQEITYLQRKGRIVKDKYKKDHLTLSSEEREAFEEIRKRSKHEEAAFHEEIMGLVERYKIPDGHQLVELLKALYVESSGVNIDRKDKRDVTAKNREQVFKEFRATIFDYLKDEHETERFIQQLRDICLNNPFLDKICASEKFLSLYRSSRLEQFINAKKKVIYIDTRVFMFYYCHLMAKGKNYPFWEDHSFRSAINLMTLVERKKKDFSVRIYETYIGEVAGELQKALRTSWFNEKIKLNLDFQTGNVFYNYYIFLRDNGAFDNDRKIHSFEDMMKMFGFSNLDAESSTFINETKASIRKRLPLIKIEVMDEDYFDQDIWESTLKQWQVVNSHAYSQKSPVALRTDTKQLLHIMKQPPLEQSKELEYYYASWDKSFVEMRDWVIQNNEDVHSFSVYNPAKMASRFALSHFKIDSQCITHDVFYYADNKFCLSNKISNLYDHVIIPYFSSRDESGLEIINQIIDIQQKYLSQNEPETVDDVNKEKMPLELVFDKLKESLKEWQCSENELMIYLLDKDNRTSVLTFFDQAFDAIKRREDYLPFNALFGEALTSYLHTKSKTEESTI